MSTHNPEDILSRVVRRFPSVAFVWLNEPGWPVLFVSDNVERLLGHTRDAFVEGRVAYADLIHPDDFDRVGGEVTRNVRPDGPELWQHDPYRLKKADGTWIWVQDTTRSVRDETGTIIELEGVITDVSRIVGLSEQLRITLDESRRQNQEYEEVIARLSQVEAVVSSSSDLLILFGTDGRLLYANTAFLKAFNLLDTVESGVLLPEIPSLGPLCNMLAEPVMASRDGRSERWEGWIDFPGKGRQYMALETRPFVADNGSVDGTVIVAQNRTDSHEQTVALQRLAKAVEHVSESIVITDSKGTIEYVNPFFEITTGYSLAEATGANPSILKGGTLRPDFYKELWSTLKEGKTWKGRFVNRRKNGELFTEDATISPIMDEQGTVTNYVAVKRDVSTEVSIMQQMRLTEQLETQNQVFQNMLHELNNRLAIITGHAELLSVLSKEGTLRPESVDAILSATGQVADLVKSGLRQVHETTEGFTSASLSDTVRQSCAMIGRILPETVTFHQDICDESLSVDMSPSDIDQIVTNLILNASEAIEDQGSIHVHVGPAAWIPEHLRTLGREDTYAKLVVSDTGCGMDENTQANMFKQFFSTKESEKASGLGLWTVKHLVDEHGGFMGVDSEPGAGTRMTIWLPVEHTQMNPVVHRISAAERLKDVHILVVDDDRAFLEMTVAMLTLAKMKVTSFDDPLEALSWLQESKDVPDIVLSDIIMPSLDGSQLAAIIAEKLPGVPVIFMSGYSEEVRRSVDQQHAYPYFLQKPFESDALMDLVTTALPTTHPNAS